MIKPSIGKLLSFIHSLVEADDAGYVVCTEVRKIVVRSMERVAILNAALVVGSSKSKELACEENREGGRRREGEGGREGRGREREGGTDRERGRERERERRKGDGGREGRERKGGRERERERGGGII